MDAPHSTVPDEPAENSLRAEDFRWMARALEQARLSDLRGEVPVGAVLVQNGRMIAEAHNLTHTVKDPTAHAEALVLRIAAGLQGDYRLEGTTLYITLEPCAMCAGAIILSRVPRVVFAARDPKSGMAGSVDDLLRHPRLNHRSKVVEGPLAEESGALLRRFFQRRRAMARKVRKQLREEGIEASLNAET